MSYITELSNLMRFTVTDQHIKLLGRLYFRFDWTEFGAPAVDPKRPYGNSYVYGDLAEILSVTPDGIDDDGDPELSESQEESLLRIHQEMMVVLQIIASTQTISTGTYFRSEQYDWRDWTPVKDSTDQHGE